MMLLNTFKNKSHTQKYCILHNKPPSWCAAILVKRDGDRELKIAIEHLEMHYMKQKKYKYCHGT